MKMTNEPRFFERWFLLLAKNRLAAALLPVSGISIGLFLVVSGHVAPQPFVWYVGTAGTVLICCSSVGFLTVTGLYIFAWARTILSQSGDVDVGGLTGERKAPAKKRPV